MCESALYRCYGNVLPVFRPFHRLQGWTGCINFSNKTVYENDHIFSPDMTCRQNVVENSSCEQSQTASNQFEAARNLDNSQILKQQVNLPCQYNIKTKGIHVANLNIRHLKPTIDELRIMLDLSNSIDIFEVCETFLNQSVDDSTVHVKGYRFERKDRLFCLKILKVVVFLYILLTISITLDVLILNHQT